MNNTKKGLKMETNHKDQHWVMRSDIVESHPSNGVTRSILAYCDSVMCVEHSFENDAVGALHAHPHAQIVDILSGVFEFTIGDETRIVRTGDSLFMPGGVEHGSVCIESGALLDVFTPMREDFI
jgi:quercetin dioxygenase-like cupin family protein